MTSFKDYSFGVLNSSITAICGILTIPIIISCFGLEGFGLVSFYYLILATLQIFDFGLSATLLRETALNFNQDKSYVKSLLRTFICIYLVFGLIFSSILILLTHEVAENWLNISMTDIEEVYRSIFFMGAALFIRWPVSLYQAVLIGSGNQVLYSKLNMAMVIFSQIGAVIYVDSIQGSVSSFFLWMFVASVVHHFMLLFFSNKQLRSHISSKINFHLIGTVWKYSLQMSGISIVGLLLTQLDKVILSKLLPLSSFAHYSLAVTITSALFIIFIPFYNIIYPKFTHCVLQNNQKKLIEFYETGSYILCALLFPLLFFLSLNSSLIVLTWTQNRQITDDVLPILIPMLIGTTIQGIMYMPYALQQALGKVKIPLIVCCFMLLLMILIMPYLATNYGAIGGAVSWLIVNVFYFFASLTFTHKYLIDTKFSNFVATQLGRPLIITFSGFLAFWLITGSAVSADIFEFCLSALIFFLCSVISLGLNKNSNAILRNLINIKRNKKNVF